MGRMMEQQGTMREVREPLVSLAMIGFLGAAMIWAANQDWVQLAIFLDEILKGWRDILRVIWTTILDRLDISFKVQEHQKDVLSLLSILLGSSLFRLLFGKKPQPLFFPSMEFIADQFGRRYGSLGRIALLLVFWATGMLIFVAILAPFFDTVRFTHDFYAWLTALFWAFALFAATSASVELITTAISTIRQHGIFSYLTMVAQFILAGIVAGTAMAVGVYLLFTFVFPFVFSLLPSFSPPKLNIPLDPKPFKFENYVSEFDYEKALDLGLITGSVVMLYFTSGRSLKPLAQFLILGGSIVLFGWLAGVVIEAFPTYFPRNA